MSITVFSSNPNVEVLPQPIAANFRAVSVFAENISSLPPPSGVVARRVFWIQSCFQQTVQGVYRLFFPDQIKKLKEQMAGAEPSQIVELASPYATVLPEFAFLVIWYGEKNEETDKLKAYWLSRGFLLFSDLSSGLIEFDAEHHHLLESFVDIISFETEILKLSQTDRILKAIDFLDVASSSLSKENIPFIANVITETFYALFPDGIGSEETKLWNLLEEVISDAKDIGGEAQGTFFDDQLLVFVKLFLRKGPLDEQQAMHAIRHHLRNANSSESNTLLSYLADKKWCTLDSITELAIIRKAIYSFPKLEPEILLRQIFKQFLDNPNFDPQVQAELYLLPSPWRDHLSALLLRYYLGPLAIPSGQEKLFTAVFLSDQEQTRYLSHLYLTDDKLVMTPPLITPKDRQEFVPYRIFRLFEEAMAHLRTHKLNNVEKLLEAASWTNIQQWFQETKVDSKNLRLITDLYRAKFLLLKEISLPEGRREKLEEEAEVIRLEVVKWMKDYWSQGHPEDIKSFPFEKYKEETLISHVPYLLEVVEPSCLEALSSFS